MGFLGGLSSLVDNLDTNSLLSKIALGYSTNVFLTLLDLM